MSFEKDYFNFEVEDFVLTEQEIQTSLMKEDVQSISEEQKLICKRQIAKAMWVLAKNLETSHDLIISDMGQEPLWSLKDLAIYCRDQIEEKGLVLPSKL